MKALLKEYLSLEKEAAYFRVRRKTTLPVVLPDIYTSC